MNQAIEPIAEVDEDAVVPDLEHFALQLGPNLELAHSFAGPLPCFLFEDVPSTDDDALFAALVLRQRELAPLTDERVGIIDVCE